MVLSNFAKFIHLGRDRIRLEHVIPKIVPSVLPGRKRTVLSKEIR